MSKANGSNPAYNAATRCLHWLTALVILGLVALGWWMVDLDYYHPWNQRALDLHKGFGVVALLLGAGFVLRAFIAERPSPLSSLRRYEVIASRCVHGILFLMMLAMPLSGYMISTSAGAGIDMFGIFTVPAFIEIPKPARDFAIDVHYWFAYIGLGVIALHAAAALKHHFIDNDRTLLRILKGR